MRDSLGGEAPGFEYFLDPVHPTSAGNFLIAHALYLQLAPRFTERGHVPEPLSESQANAALGLSAPLEKRLYSPRNEEEHRHDKENPSVQLPSNPEESRVDLEVKRMAAVSAMGDHHLQAQYIAALLEGMKFEEALVVAQQSVARFPEKRGSWRRLGECMLKLGRKEEALDAFEREIKHRPDETIHLMAGLGITEPKN